MGHSNNKQDRIKILADKENYKCLRILEVEIIKESKIKEAHFKKCTSDEREIYLKPGSAAGSFQMNTHPGCSHWEQKGYGSLRWWQFQF